MNQTNQQRHYAGDDGEDGRNGHDCTELRALLSIATFQTFQVLDGLRQECMLENEPHLKLPSFARSLHSTNAIVGFSRTVFRSYLRNHCNGGNGASDVGSVLAELERTGKALDGLIEKFVPTTPQPSTVDLQRLFKSAKKKLTSQMAKLDKLSHLNSQK